MPTSGPAPPPWNISFYFYQAALLIVSVWRAGSAVLTCRVPAREVGCQLGYQRTFSVLAGSWRPDKKRRLKSPGLLVAFSCLTINLHVGKHATSFASKTIPHPLRRVSSLWTTGAMQGPKDPLASSPILAGHVQDSSLHPLSSGSHLPPLAFYFLSPLLSHLRCPTMS